MSELAQAIAASPAQDIAVDWLRTVPGLPPIVQTVHILSIACVFASAMMIDLRILGWAAPSQSADEMVRRLMPWMWSALVLLFLSGAMFVVARPRRYLLNPVFGIKFLLLLIAVLSSVAVKRLLSSSRGVGFAKAAAGVSLAAWVGVILAGRWIAYSDYLFPPD